jgi:hypothetical protein
MIALLANKTTAKALAALILVLSLMAGAWWIHGRIYDDGYQAAILVKDAEIATILRENAQADADEQPGRPSPIMRRRSARPRPSPSLRPKRQKI